MNWLFPKETNDTSIKKTFAICTGEISPEVYTTRYETYDVCLMVHDVVANAVHVQKPVVLKLYFYSISKKRVSRNRGLIFDIQHYNKLRRLGLAASNER